MASPAGDRGDHHVGDRGDHHVGDRGDHHGTVAGMGYGVRASWPAAGSPRRRRQGGAVGVPDPGASNATGGIMAGGDHPRHGAPPAASCTGRGHDVGAVRRRPSGRRGSPRPHGWHPYRVTRPATEYGVTRPNATTPAMTPGPGRGRPAGASVPATGEAVGRRSRPDPAMVWTGGRSAIVGPSAGGLGLIVPNSVPNRRQYRDTRQNSRLSPTVPNCPQIFPF